MLKMATYRMQAKGLSDFLPYSHFIDEGIILNKNGSLTAIFMYRGEDLDSCDDDEKNLLKHHLNQSLMKFGSGWMFHIDYTKVQKNEYPAEDDCAFPDPTSYVIDQERRARYNQRNLHFENFNHISLTFMPPNDAEAKFGDLMLTGREAADRVTYSHHLQRFKQALEKLVAELGDKLSLKRLSTDQAYSFLHWCISGHYLPLKLYNPVADLDYALGEVADVTTTLNLKVNQKAVRVLTITDFPDRTRPAILEALCRLKFEFRWNTRYIILDTADSDTLIRKRLKTWFGKRTTAKQLIGKSIAAGDAVPSEESVGNLDAEIIANETKGALRDNALGLEKNGYYTSTIILFDEDSSVLDEKVKIVQKTLNDAFFIAKDESINAFFAYLGSQPGNGAANIRIPIVSTRALCDLMSLNSVWSGLDYNPNPLLVERGINNPPLLQCVTSGAQPFKHSLHVEEFGNALVAGPTGGLAVYLNLVALQAFKYRDARVYFFDRQKHAMAACYGVGGQYYDIGDSNNAVNFQPLRDLETQQQRQLAKTFIRLLCEIKIKDFKLLTTDQEKAIDDILLLLKAKDYRQRTLSNFVTFMLPRNQEIALAVQHYTVSGPYGLLFDSNDVACDFIGARMACFELDYLANQYGEEALVPLVVYIFNKLKIELFYKKHPVYIIVYECWKLLTTSRFVHYLEDILRSGTTNNISMVLATSDVSDVLASELRSLIISHCQTKIFLPNPAALNAVNYPVYQLFGLSDKQINIIANAVGRRQFYYSSPYGKRLFELDICDYTRCFTSVHDPMLTCEIYQRDKEQFAFNWVMYFAQKHNNKTLEEWANYWLQVRSKFNRNFVEFNDGQY